MISRTEVGENLKFFLDRITSISNISPHFVFEAPASEEKGLYY
jgi:hypothetical protein